jgi:tetratricopeptide (TPR) repeat protein
MLLALNEYLKAYKESPNDAQIVKKIATVYFDLKRFTQAFEYYEKVESSLDDSEREKMMLSLLY